MKCRIWLLLFYLCHSFRVRRKTTTLDKHGEFMDSVVQRSHFLNGAIHTNKQLDAYLGDLHGSNPRSEMRRIINDFRGFKERLLRSDSQFATLCMDVVGGILSKKNSISCGNTLTCFLELFSAYSEPFISYSDTVQLAAARQPYHSNELMKFEYPKMTNNLAQLVLTGTGRQFLLDLGRIHLEKLHEELMKDDVSDALPRIFDIDMEWKVIVKQHVLKWHSDKEGGLENFEIKVCDLLVNRKFLPSLKPALREFLQDWFSAANAIRSCGQTGLLGAIGRALSTMFHEKSRSVVVHVPRFIPKMGDFDATEFEAELTIDDVENLCAESRKENSSITKRINQDFAEFSETCPQLLASVSAQWTPSPESQNHVFAIVKKESNNFGIVQGYIAGKEPGYDLKEWLQSNNKFAATQGIGRTLMSEFLRHLQVFVENGMTVGTFDGDNHAATFNVHEYDFVGQRYFSFFRFNEMGKTQEVGAGRVDVQEHLIALVMKSMTCAQKEAEGV